MDGVSKSPKEVTEGVDVNPSRRVGLLDVGLGVRDGVPRVMLASSSSASGVPLSGPESSKKRKAREQQRTWIYR